MGTQAKLQLEDVEQESSSLTMTAAELRPILEAIIYVAGTNRSRKQLS